METVFTLALNILPLHVLILLGYIAGRWLDVNLHSLARIAIFIISPIVIFGAVARIDFDPAYAALPFIILCISLLITLSVYNFALRRWKSNTANLIGLGSVSGNTGYFGLPLVLALYGTEWAGVYLFMNFATVLSEQTVGYYLAARGHHTIRDSLKRVLKLPGVHAIYLALIVNFANIELPALFNTYWTYATGAWVYIGMMLIGVALSKLQKLEFDLRLTAWLFTVKFVLWPALGVLFIVLDQTALHLFPVEVHGLILIICSVPIMANLVAFSAQLNLHPEKAAMVVLFSTLFALFYMPALIFAVTYFGLMS